MREIGGFLEWETYYGKEFYSDCIALNSGRNCFRYLIRARKIESIWLPKLLCSAILDVCKEEKVRVSFYSVDKAFRPIIPCKIEQEEWFYLINYYGQIDVESVKSYARHVPHLIVDNAQAFYIEPLYGIDTIYTCRKFFGVTDGGYLFSSCHMTQDLVQDESGDRLNYLIGRYERTAHEYYLAYQSNEILIKNLPLKMMSKATHNMLRSIDYERIKCVREKNFSNLHQHFKNINQFKIRQNIGPYMYPLLVEHGKEIREKLQREKIYVPLLWPNVLDDLKSEEEEYQLAANVLPLPCDQRYGLTDMNYVAEQVKMCIQEDDVHL